MLPMRTLVLPLVAVLAIGAAPKPVVDHRQTAVESAAGWTFGRAGAPLLVEYASFGCSHCGDYAAATGQRVDQLVKSGKLRFAFRPFLIFPHDFTATALARCVTPKRRLGFINAVLLGQSKTKAKLAAADADEAMRGRLFAAELEGPLAHARLLVDVSGLGDLAREHGLTAAQLKTCLASEANGKWVREADSTSRMSGVTGTPTYMWNGQQLGPDLTPDRLLATLPR
jgi:protein-disulfide isomerase